MTVETVERLAPVNTAGRVGQATVVEQSRAVAEVMAAVQVAQACPRSLGYAVDEMRRSCQQMRLAERAFFRYNRGDGTVSGPSVHLARELARCWGNFQSGIAELRRDDDHGQSEMQAWAWDVQTNSRASTTFIVPHARDTKKGRKDLTDLRDVYENNANNGARRLREMILGLLPQWYVEEAKDLCTKTVEAGDGKPLEQRVRDAIAAFEGIGVAQERVERKIGHPASAWTPRDVATLSVIFTSLKRGEILVEDEFAQSRVTADDVTPTAPAPAAAPAPTPSPTGSAPGTAAAHAAEAKAGIDEGTWRRINERFREIGVNGTGQSQARLVVMRSIISRPDLARGSEMTAEQGQMVLDNLTGEAGPRLVTDVLRADNAPEHLIPLVGGYIVDPDVVVHQPTPDEQHAPTEEDDPGHLEDAAAAQEAATGEEYDPTTADDWPAAQEHEDDSARDDAAADQ